MEAKVKRAAPRGTQDILPPDTLRWEALEAAFRAVCTRYQYGEIRTPTFEETDLFTRAVGEHTDIVSKEMYTFTDRGDRSMTLRPEGTASVVRSFIEHKLHGEPDAHKLYYIAAIFRYERPQAGRYREHHQLGVECLGPAGPDADAEVIALAFDLLGSLGLGGATLHLGSVGCPLCRPDYRRRLQDFLRPHLASLCEYCQARFDTNPLRILDDKNPRCQELTQGAPVMLDHLCAECQAHHEAVLRALDAARVPHEVDPRIVRGLDYYTRTAFEIMHAQLGAQNVLVGGGRYDGLVEELGGPPTPAVGFGSGIERLLLVLEQQGWQPPAPPPPIYVAVAQGAGETGWQVVTRLRQAGLPAQLDLLHRSLKAQMKEADRLRSRWVVILGEDEVKTGAATVRDMTSGEQQPVALDVLAFWLKDKGRQ